MLQKVATTGVDLDSVYAQTLQRIREQKGDRSRLGIEVLMWISHAERPLRINELCHALAVDTQSTDLDPEDIPPQDTVLGSCLGLAVVDAGALTVRPIHYTLQEYLSRPGILPDAHKKLGHACLAYLNYNQVKRLPARSSLYLSGVTFLEYSSLYWGSHAKVQLSDCAKSLALELFDRAGNHISATILLNWVGWFHSCSLPHHVWPGLHSATYFGIVEVVAALIETKSCDINQSDCFGFTALTWAARQGNEEVVRLLLTRGEVSLNQTNGDSRTPLWWASLYGHEGVARLLLARGDVSPDMADADSPTPLWCASWKGHEGVVKLLLTRGDVDPNKRYMGWTPFQCASERGHKGVVKLLPTRVDAALDMLGAYPHFFSRAPHIPEHQRPTASLEDYQSQLMMIEMRHRWRLIQKRSE